MYITIIDELQVTELMYKNEQVRDIL